LWAESLILFLYPDVGRRINMPSLYLDCDGVLTDFSEAVQRLGVIPSMGLAPDSNPVLRQHMYDRIEEAGESFWATMPFMRDGKQLWDYFKKYNPVVLTSPGKFKYCKAGRTRWFAENLPGVSVFFEEEKWIYSGRDNILIDDMYTNIEPWQRMGGVGILHKDFETTRKEFEKIMAQPAMKVSLASHLRDIVAFLSINNLKEYLNKAQGVLSPSSPIKSIITKEILNKDVLKDEDIKATYKKIKEIVKGYNQSYREPFQITILQPFQAYFDKNVSFNPVKLLSEIKTQKDIMRKPEQELSETKKTIKDVSEIPFPKVLSRSRP
jgi:hypothetical protein